MGKKGKKDAKKHAKPKPSSITPPDSEPGSETLQRLRKENEETSLGLTLGPLKLVARSPFNTIVNPADTITLWTKDNIEFFASRSLLSIASPHFCNYLGSQEEALEEDFCASKKKLRPEVVFEWELDEVATAVEFDETSAVLDPLLRFLYPVPEPVFKEPANGKSLTELPYRLMGPIYDTAKKYEFSYVCQKILDIAHDIIYSKSLPEPGLAALRAYGVACRLNLSYEAKVRAARNALCIPYQVSPTAGLEGQGITRGDIQRYAKFHYHAVQAVQDLLQLSPTDAYPIGLLDVYATFVACPHCNGNGNSSSPPTRNVAPNPMRCGAARWWQLYVSNALEKLRRAPLDPNIFFENFLTPVFREAQVCQACASVVHWKWCNMMPMLAQTIPARVYEIPLGEDEGGVHIDSCSTEDDSSTEDESEQYDRTFQPGMV